LLSLSAGCGDVLTKPKLDKHQATCRSSFDCIDCGKRFETPADYKGHTSCISEAEKYHKTLYNGGVSEYVILFATIRISHGDRVVLGGMVEINNRGSREEGNGAITARNGNNGT